MNIEEVTQLRKELQALSAASVGDCTLQVDTFHHPYLEFPEQFTLPTVNLYGIELDQARKLLAPLMQRMPGFVRDCHVLPEPRPIKENNYLHLIKPMVCENRQYVYMFKILAQYLGGASEKEILQDASSGVSAEVRTNRIYFHARLIPVESIEYKNDCVVDFRPVRLKEALLEGITRAQGFHVATKEMRVLDMFDEIDYSQANEELTNMFSVGAEWKPGKVFRPFLVDYHTLTMNLVFPDHELLPAFLKHFDQGFTELVTHLNLDQLAEDSRAFWAAYFQSFRYERILSRSNNPHWQLVEYPNAQWLQNTAG